MILQRSSTRTEILCGPSGPSLLSPHHSTQPTLRVHVFFACCGPWKYVARGDRERDRKIKKQRMKKEKEERQRKNRDVHPEKEKRERALREEKEEMREREGSRTIRELQEKTAGTGSYCELHMPRKSPCPMETELKECRETRSRGGTHQKQNHW